MTFVVSYPTKGSNIIGVQMIRLLKKLQTTELKIPKMKRGLQLGNCTTMFTTLMDRISTRGIRSSNQRLEPQRVQHLWMIGVRTEFPVDSDESLHMLGEK